MRIFCTSPQLSPQTTLENNGVFFLIGKYMEMRSQKQVHTYMVIFFFLIKARKQSNEEKKISKKCS